MIAKNHRFFGLGSLNNVYRRGNTVRAGKLTLKYLHSKKSDYRLAVVVSKKIHKSAVVRNRIRRRIFETIRNFKKQQDQKWPVDVIISVFDEDIATLEQKQLEKYIKSLLTQAKIIRD